MPHVRPVAPRGRPDLADRADVAGVLRGDEASFERLVERHHPALCRLAASRGVRRDAARPVLLRTWRAFLDGLDAQEPEAGELRPLLIALLLAEVGERGRRRRPDRQRDPIAPAPGRHARRDAV